ncbi:Retrovirus-related Pol polyprotein from transposon TNT 1-94 [Dendrobium catenatum]|uniref:Retrovirus-related Pol polyprotein from transposon TNT 1-94 n=1 Tax=Dendrobium catenatum TaxID=906689 RepID=A0A2I0XB61_9ASPA|nr:Retrovirus-related Pol polyprotein from transposon TNT 1-94 [Dendrobium catenatum]
MASSENSHLSESTEPTAQEESAISPNLKFVVSNIKNLVPTQLDSANYAIWRSQILKIFRANAFDKYHDSSHPIPSPTVQDSSTIIIPNPAFSHWNLTDQHLSSSLCSTISASILPYVVNLDSTSTIWSVLESRFQSMNRSKVIQLKNTLHNISIKNMSMTQYLSEIKTLVDQIAAAGSVVDNEDIILYILNGLPSSYQSFKTAIRTMITPISLDHFYPLLLSEEINLASDALKNHSPSDTNMAMFTYRGRGKRNRGRSNTNTGNTNTRTPQSSTICHICFKKGHCASECWHCLNSNYVPPASTQQNRALAAASETSNNCWYLDSGATSHLTNSLDNMTISSPYQGSDRVIIGDGRPVNIANSGAGLLPTPDRKLKLSQILHAPSLRYNLLSISNLTKDNNISVTFNPFGFVFKDLTTQQVLFQGPCHNRLYPIRNSFAPPQPKALVSKKSPVPWHQSLGHPHDRTLRLISSCNSHLKIIDIIHSCKSCKESKCHKLPFEYNASRTCKPLDLIHSDIWGPAPINSVQGYRYYLLFVGDFSRFSWIFPMRMKCEVFEIFTVFKQQIEKYTSHSIKVIRTDGGSEYLNRPFTTYLKQHGITHQISCPYTPEQNGVAERKHRHIIETCRTLMHTASVPLTHWPEAALTSVYLINRMPSANTRNMSPFELLHNIKPTYNHLSTFGCTCYPLLPPHNRHKLQPKSKSCVFFGYSDQYKGCKCLDISTNKILISRHVTFDELSFPFQTHNPPITHPTVDIPSTLLQPCSAITRSQTGTIKPTNRLNLCHANNLLDSQTAPTSYTEAVKHQEWRKVMSLEFLALQEQGTWSLVPPPPNSSILGFRWTYRIKTNSNGTIAKYKARLVAQGNNQEYGLDYTEAFSHVAKLPMIRILLNIALCKNWQINQLDVANAFLHGNLSETIYMTQPKGFEDASHPEYVCHLNKALYGLKQAPRQWYNTFTSFLLSIGFIFSTADPSLLILHDKDVEIYILIYVDDILITGNSNEYISTIITKLSNRFHMKNLGSVHDFLAI